MDEYVCGEYLANLFFIEKFLVNLRRINVLQKCSMATHFYLEQFLRIIFNPFKSSIIMATNIFGPTFGRIYFKNVLTSLWPTFGK